MRNFFCIIIIILTLTSCKNIKKAPPKFEGPDEIVIKVF